MPYDPGNPRGEYDRSKARASIEVLDAGKNDLHTAILCPTGTLGPYDWRLSPITQTFLDFYNGKMNIGINGAYDFVDVRDVAIGHMLASEKAASGENFILSGERVTMKKMFAMLEEITGVKGPDMFIPMRLAKAYCCFTPLYYRISGKTPRYTNYSLNTLLSNSYISHRKATEELGYRTRPVKESIRDTFKWFRDYGFIK
jgi:dihydroflavonol-4-reductase